MSVDIDYGLNKNNRVSVIAEGVERKFCLYWFRYGYLKKS